MMRRAMCLPLGLGARGEVETVRFDGREYECVPFRVEVSSCQMWNGDAVGHEQQAEAPRLPFMTQIHMVGVGATPDPEPLDVTTAFNEGSASTIMVWTKHPVFRAMRNLVTPEEAESALAILSAPDDEVASWKLPWAHTRDLCELTDALTDEAWAVVNDGSLDRVCKLIRGAGELHNAHGAVYRVVYSWRFAVAAEISEVLGGPDHEIHRLAYSRVKKWF